MVSCSQEMEGNENNLLLHGPKEWRNVLVKVLCLTKMNMMVKFLNFSKMR